MAVADVARPDLGSETVSPRQNAPPIEQAIRSIANPLGTLDMRADPDAQATVTDFLDFTEYLPSDMMRSLTLIGKLDQTHVDSSTKVHQLTTLWGHLPTIPPAERTGPVELRAQISDNLHRAVSSRVYSHAEAVRMSENLNRHYNRAKTILAKLETMLENYPTAEEQKSKSPVATSKSPQLSRAPKIALRLDGQKVRRPRIPRITVPGEVLAPYELNYEAYSSGTESSSEEEDSEDDEEVLPAGRATPAPQRLKVAKSASRPLKPGKIPKPRTSVPPPNYPGGLSTSAALAQHKPPPDNVVIGSADAPWGQLTPYELARLRKRMKKNAAWAPSDTMVARELSNLGRGIEAFKAAKKKAEEEGKPFDGRMPMPVLDPETGDERMPLGALTMEALATDEKNLSNRGMRLNEAKKAKRKALAELAAEEAEESAKRFLSIAETLMSTPSSQPLQEKAASKVKPPKKRKRDSLTEADAERPKLTDGPAQRPPIKRTKTETPVPPPQINPSPAQLGQETAVQPPHRIAVAPLHSTTPIPLPAHGQDHSITAKSGTSVASATSPAPSSNAGHLGTAVSIPAPVKLPAATETPIPPPVHSPKKSTTPILPPVRETRKVQTTRMNETPREKLATPTPKPPSRAPSPAPLSPKTEPDAGPATADPTPSSPTSGTATTPAPGTTTTTRRPASRGKATSQEPQPSLAADRPRRASTARNTPAPERAEPTARPSSRRSKRPAPGIISRTVSGGNSAVGKRKAAPKKKSARASSGGGAGGAKGGKEADLEPELDDEGNVIPPNEERYCHCERVSFGTMILCENVDNCKYEWFHLECVGLEEIPARTTKWYCPECRILLNIGEKGEVSARGVKA